METSRMNETLRVLRRCVDPDDAREWLSNVTPWNGQTIATDGVILCIGPSLPVGVIETDPRVAKVAQKIVDQVTTQTMLPMSEGVHLPIVEPCGFCQGTGEAPRKATCPECGGEGETTAHTDFNEYLVTCKTCSGKGWHLPDPGALEECRDCWGSGTVAAGTAIGSTEYVHLYGAVLALNYYRILLTLGDDVMVRPQEEHGWVLFKTTTYMGAVMGIRRPWQKDPRVVALDA